MNFDKELAERHASAVDAYIEAYHETEEYTGLPIDQQEDWDFAANRLYSIGGSDMAAIMGLSPWKTRFQVWQEKTLRVEPSQLGVGNVFTHWGHLMESVIGKEYDRLIGHYYGRYVPAPWFPENTDTPQIKVNLDGAIYQPGTAKVLRVHEIKTAMTNAYSGDYDKEGRAILNWGDGNRYLEDETGLHVLYEDGQIPLAYRLQVETYMMIVGADVADISVLIGHHDFRTFTVHANKELQAKIVKAADEFWLQVLNDEPPELQVADYEKRRDNGDLVPIDEQTAQAFQELLGVRTKYNVITQRRKQLEEKIKAYIGDNSGLMDASGKVLATWKKSAARMKFDADAFEKEHPDMYAQYMRPSKTTRTFLVKVKE